MQRHVVIYKLQSKQPHTIVLAGDKPVDDMLVFIMYRKLNSILRAGAETETVGKTEKQFKDAACDG